MALVSQRQMTLVFMGLVPIMNPISAITLTTLEQARIALICGFVELVPSHNLNNGVALSVF